MSWGIYHTCHYLISNRAMRLAYKCTNHTKQCPIISQQQPTRTVDFRVYNEPRVPALSSHLVSLVPRYISRIFQITMTSLSSTIIIEDEEHAPHRPPIDPQIRRISPNTSPENPTIEPNDTTSGSIMPSRKRKRGEEKQSNILVQASKTLSFSRANNGSE